MALICYLTCSIMTFFRLLRRKKITYVPMSLFYRTNLFKQKSPLHMSILTSYSSDAAFSLEEGIKQSFLILKI